MRKHELISWQLLNGAGEVHAESGTFTSRNSEITVELADNECYEFNIKNSHNGVNGKFKIKDADNKTLLYARSFPANHSIKIDYTTQEAVSTENSLDQVEVLNISPNPSTGIFSISLHSNEALDVKTTITSILGDKISERIEKLSVGNNELDYNIANVSNGIYLIHFSASGRYLTKKIVINN